MFSGKWLHALADAGGIAAPASALCSVHLRDAADPCVGILFLRQHAGVSDAAGGDDGFKHAVVLGPDLNSVLMHCVAPVWLLVSVCRMSKKEWKKRVKEETGEAGPEARSPGEGDWGN